MPKKVEVFSHNNRQPHIARDDRKESEDDQRNGHNGGRFMNVFLDFRLEPLFPVKSQEDKTEHVEGRQYGTQDS